MNFSHSIKVLSDHIARLQNVVAERKKELEGDLEFDGARIFIEHDIINGESQIKQHQAAIDILRKEDEVKIEIKTS